MRKIAVSVLVVVGLLSAVVVARAATPILVAPYPLKIVQPQAGLNTKHRFYKAYPGLLYNVRAGVTGGNYPYQHTLTVAPSGMMIDSFTGEIIWPTPTTTASPHAVSLQVTDQVGTVATVSWTITVTTRGFRFLDAVNGKTTANGGTGAVDKPWRTIEDMYEGTSEAASLRDTYKDAFLYFRNGTYQTFKILATTIPGGIKPIVWMAYPGESPLIDASNGGLWFSMNGSSGYFEGFELVKARWVGVNLRGNAAGSNSIARKNTFHDLPKPRIPNNNTAALWADSPNSVIQDNHFYDLSVQYGIIAFDGARQVLVENNLFHDLPAPHGWFSHSAIGVKAGCQMWFIRGNRMYNLASRGIFIMYENNDDTRDLEVSYNMVTNQLPGSANFSFYAIPHTRAGLLYVHHNTFGGNVMVYKMDSTDGPFYFYNNTIVNRASGTPEGSHITLDTVSNPERVHQIDNLAGYPDDGIVDPDQKSPSLGNLTTAYTRYLGLRGHQLPLRKPTQKTK